MLQEKGEEEGGKKGKKEGSNEGQARDGERNIPQLAVVGAVSAKTGETPRHASVFVKDIGLQFSVLIVSDFGYQCESGFIECLWKYSQLFNLLGEFEKNQYKVFFVCLVEFTCEVIWSWTFVCNCMYVFCFLAVPDGI